MFGRIQLEETIEGQTTYVSQQKENKKYDLIG